MKPIFIIFLFIFSLVQLKAQDDIKDYHEPEVSTGSSITLGGNLGYNDYHDPVDPYFTIDVRNADVNSFMNASHWRFTPKLSYGLFATATGEYHYHQQKQQNILNILQENVPAEDINEISQIKGNVYATGEYYLNPKIFYGLAYEGYLSYSSRYIFSNQIPFNANNTSRFNYWYGSSTFWFSVGFGKIINAARVTKNFNFEKILKKEGLITAQLSSIVKEKLNGLLDKRNNKDYLSKYKDDDEIIFFKDVENLLISEGVINKPLGAETTLRMYQSLNNDKFLYYPKYKGIRLQLDMQLNPVDNGAGANFAILSGVYGFPIFNKTRGVFAAFTAMPLSKKQPGYGLFTDIRNPFSNALPVTLEQFQLDKYTLDFYGSSMSDYRTGIINITGFKLHLFHSFNSYAGIILKGQYLYSKPEKLANFSEFDAAMQIDYNILSFIKLSGEVALIKNNNGFSSLGFTMGTSIIIF